MRRLAVVVFGLWAVFPVSAKNAVLITFEEKAVVAQVTPGSSTAWFLVAQQPTGRGTKLIHGADIHVDDDRDGIVRVALKNSPVPSSVWIVVDLDSGEHAVAAPTGPPLRRKLSPAALHGRGNGKPARILQRELLTVFMVARPGVGAWIAKIEDGTIADGDAAPDGEIIAALEKLTPVGKSPAPPDDFQRDDVVVLTNPLTLIVYDGKVVK